MPRIFLAILLALCALAAFAAQSPTSFSVPQATVSAKSYCTTAAPTQVTGAYVPFSTSIGVVASGVGSTTTITESDLSGGTYKTVVDTSVANTTTVSCPVKQ